ncbi:hypothetical protein QJS10_CPB17g00587 [Acorus calamus]|uniref:DNA polymerase beta thumb domain-containing protein n=1 Tax=Acorus calamus TaxID=4465 RepID=A0AAV9CWC8_ACOCL|nr:hypothetical protein QJS10_CPB17g00582 [Acorus calamus]KAK1293135.1 hypothetical protein QJS10_CPB17g00587 [Acorus calamus]
MHQEKGSKSSISLICKTEREVFDELGFPWLEPHERDLDEDASSEIMFLPIHARLVEFTRK